ncbi:MAG: single-stranded DNA-binding protein [Actinomycetales bacterium]|nr:single-stranded DNA-binding protein [Actinomycetales bacterium]
MYETYVTVAGNVTADPVLRSTKAGKPFVTFRVASTSRRYDGRVGGFVDGGTNFMSVVAFNALAANVVASVSKGQPVVVHGRLRVNTWSASEGHSMTSVEIDAYHVGHDLSRGQSHFSKPQRAQFDPNDRLAEDEVQGAIEQLAGDEDERESSGAPVAAESDAAQESDEVAWQGERLPDGWLPQGAGDPQTDPYIIAKAS